MYPCCVGRLILRYTGAGAIPGGHIEQLRSRLRVVDESPRMLLVEGEEEDVRRALAPLEGWSVSREKTYPIPDTRKLIKHR